MKFLNVKGIPNYLVDETGGVWSLRKGGKRSTPRNAPLRLKPWICKDGYEHVTVRIDGKPKRIGVHRLVLMAFVGFPTKEKNECRHLNGIRTDNRPHNLLWGTTAENAQDKIIHGRSSAGSRNCKAKLTDADVSDIRMLCGLGVIKLRIAEQFGISSAEVSKIALGQVWK